MLLLGGFDGKPRKNATPKKYSQMEMGLFFLTSQTKRDSATREQKRLRQRQLAAPGTAGAGAPALSGAAARPAGRSPGRCSAGGHGRGSAAGLQMGVVVKLKPPGIGPQILVHLYQGNPFCAYPIFDPQPNISSSFSAFCFAGGVVN